MAYGGGVMGPADAQIASCIEEAWTHQGAYLEVHIDKKALDRLQVGDWCRKH